MNAKIDVCEQLRGLDLVIKNEGGGENKTKKGVCIIYVLATPPRVTFTLKGIP